MDAEGGSAADPLTPAGVDFSNITQATDFLAEILNDDQLKITGNAYARYFWYGVAVVIGIATIQNIIRRLVLRSRLKAASQNRARPAKPKHRLLLILATTTAVFRESTYLQFTPTQRWLWLRVPPVGTIFLIAFHFTFVMVLEFANNDIAGAQFWQARGVRAGWLAVAQMPLLILLVGKNNVIGTLTNVSYERLNVLHRWTARIMLFCTILHFAYQSYGWQRYGLMRLEWSTDACPLTGIAAFALLLWMNLSTLAPIRNWSYEFFVIQHIVTFFGFIIAVMMHLPSTALTSRVYVYIPIAVYLLERLIRTMLFLLLNLPSRKATLTALEGEVTRIRLTNPHIRTWRPGSFVLLSIPKFGMLQSHPVTIASTPHSHNGDMVFLLKSHQGFTKRLMQHANTSSTTLLPASPQSTTESSIVTYRAFTNGPYGGSHSDFAAFDSVFLLAGSTGVTFTLSILQDLAERASKGRKLPLRRVHFVWCVKATKWTTWCREELSSACSKLHAAGIEIEASVFVTCADAFTEPGEEVKECGCACDKKLGPCCCVIVEDDSDDDDDASPRPSSLDIFQGKNLPSPPPPRNAAISRRSPPPFFSRPAEMKKGKGLQLSFLPCADFYSGRPDLHSLVLSLLERAKGESGLAVCGPIAMSAHLRNTVVRLSDERAVHKGSGAQGIYLHVESFS